MLQPRAVQLTGAKQGAKRAARVGFHLEQGPTVWAGGTWVEKGVDLSLQQVSLQGAEELFGLRQGQPEMLDAFVVFVERDHLGDGLFLTLIAAHDELQFDTHTGASPSSSGRGMIQAIVPELLHNPQHLPALSEHRHCSPAAILRISSGVCSSASGVPGSRYLPLARPPTSTGSKPIVRMMPSARAMAV